MQLYQLALDDPDAAWEAYQILLEGADVAGECLYFVNPDFGSFWFDNNLDLVVQIGRRRYRYKLVFRRGGRLRRPQIQYDLRARQGARSRRR